MLTKEIIEAAITGFEAQKRHIDEQLGELRAMLSSASAGSASTSQSADHRKRGMSEAGRKAIAEAQRKRWAEKRESVPPKSLSKPKRKLSAAGRGAIVAALKKRWAAKKAASGGETEAAKKTTRKKAA